MKDLNDLDDRGALVVVVGVIVVVALLWLLVSVLVGGGGNDAPAPHPLVNLADGGNAHNNVASAAPPTPATPPPAREVFKITAAELSALYDANEVAANMKIGRRIVEVTGTIASIDETWGHPAISFALDESVFGPRLVLLDSEMERAATLHKGQVITIRCPKMSKGIGPYGEGCTIAP